MNIIKRATTAVVVATLSALALPPVASAQEPYEPTDTFTPASGPDDPGYWNPTGPTAGTQTSIPNPSNYGGGQRPVPCTTAADETVDLDVVRLTDEGIDFGDTTWLLTAPVGIGSVEWAVDCGYYSALVVGTMHLDGVAGQYGRMRVSYWSGEERVDVQHSPTRRAPDNRHYEWPVRLDQEVDAQVSAVVVCTEISDDGVNFDQVSCATRYLGD